jgi:S1-C subfamily serine protease
MLENVLKGVVTVAVYQTDAAMKPMGFRGAPSDMAYSKVLDLTGAKESGSGFIINYNNKNYIITNAHVVQNASSQNGSIYAFTISYKKYAAKIVGGDTFYDLAVLEFTDDVPANEITALKFESDEARLGEQVYAIGNPLGDYPFSVSDGIISAKNRIRGGITGKFGFLQTTATIIWGNSGGPLVDLNGNVAGINSQIAFAEMDNTSIWQPQINFALEAGIAQRLIHDILNNNGLVKRAFFGIEIAQNEIDANDAGAAQPIQPENLPNSLPVIKNIIPKSPADGILNEYKNAVVLAVNNEEVRNVQEVLGAFEKIKPGDVATISLSKDNQTSTVKITTGTSNAQTNAAIANYAMSNKGCSLKQGENSLMINFSNQQNTYSGYNGQSQNDVINLGQKRQVNPQILFDNSWSIAGAGILSDQNSQVWLIKDVTDLGTVVRLCSTTGIVDLILLKSGADPSDTNNYLRKRFYFSGNNYSYQQTLLY